MKMKVFIVLWLCVCLFGGCVAPRVMHFVERGVFPPAALDSVLCANSLPALERWRSVGLVTIDRHVVGQYTFVRALGGRKSDECIYTVETRDSVFLFVKRIRTRE